MTGQVGDRLQAMLSPCNEFSFTIRIPMIVGPGSVSSGSGRAGIRRILPDIQSRRLLRLHIQPSLLFLLFVFRSNEALHALEDAVCRRGDAAARSVARERLVLLFLRLSDALLRRRRLTAGDSAEETSAGIDAGTTSRPRGDAKSVGADSLHSLSPLVDAGNGQRHSPGAAAAPFSREQRESQQQY